MKLLKDRLLSLALRIFYVYALLWGLRLLFWWYNYSVIGAIDASEWGELISGALLFDTANVGYTFSLFTVLSLLPLSAKGLRSKWYRVTLCWSYLLGVFLVVLFNVGDAVYFHFARKRFSGEEFHFFNNDNSSDIIVKSMTENWYLVLLIVALMYLSYRVYRWCARKVLDFKYGLKNIVTYSILLVVSIGLIVVAMRGGIGRDVRPITLSNAAGYVKTPLKASLVLSNPFSILRTIGEDQPVRPHFMDSTELAKYYTPVHSAMTQDSLFGSQRGKNLVIFVLESFSAEHSKFLYPDLYEESLTPFIDSLMQHSLTFTRAYANGAKSIDALPSILSSIPSLEIPFSTTSAALSDMDGIGHFLAEQNYDTKFYNGSPKGSMGYDAYARLAGVKQAVSMDDYQLKYGNEGYDGFWGIFDMPFFEYFNEELSVTPQPFFASLFTLTSHHPFVVPKEYEDILPKGHTKVHQPVAYTDLSLKRFYEAASREAWFENSVFVFVADHVSSELYSDFARTTLGNTHIVYFIHTPDGSLQGLDSTITQQIDIAPTLYHLFGRESDYFSFGRNVFDDSTDAFAINNNMGIYQLITPEGIEQCSLDELLSSPSSDHKKLKAIVQNYWSSISDKKFTVD
ncbi:MAG: sulfatase-like hydrolase/transferase [Rikenellaceae bacterium]